MLGNEILIKHYSEEKYSVFFNRRTGFFARIEDKGIAEPLWSQHGPELLDISITNWCDRYCEFCYRNSNERGVSISVPDYKKILAQAKELDVFQVALGGGNTNQHPNFKEILQITRKEFNIVPSYTTSGVGINSPIVKATKEYCGAVAVSYYPPLKLFTKVIRRFIDEGIKTNIHFLLDFKSVNEAIKLLEDVPDYLNGINSIIFLNYKPNGISSDYRLLKNSNNLKNFFSLISNNRYPFKIGFDSCSISGILIYLNINPCYVEPCEATRFSAFISEDMKMYPCSFMCNTNMYGDLRKQSMRDIWLNNTYFQEFRYKIINSNCDGCKFNKICLGGCHFIEEINLCKVTN